MSDQKPGKPTAEERAREAAERIRDEKIPHGHGIWDETWAEPILVALQAQHEQDIETACAAVCQYCRDGREHKELYPVYCRAIPIRRALESR